MRQHLLAHTKHECLIVHLVAVWILIYFMNDMYWISYAVQEMKESLLILIWTESCRNFAHLEICSISGVNLIVSFRRGPNSDTPSPLPVEVRGWYFLNTTFSGFVYLVSTYRIISLFQFLGSSVTFSGLSFFRLQIPKKYIPLLSLSMC